MERIVDPVLSVLGWGRKNLHNMTRSAPLKTLASKLRSVC